MRKREKINFKLLVAVFCFLIAVFGLSYFGKQFKSEVNERIGHYATITATEIINESVFNVLEDSEFSPVNVLKDSSQKVVSIETDTKAINLIKVRISKQLVKNLNLLTESSMRIPFFNLTENSFLSSRGPFLECKFIPVGSVNTRITSEFESVGINQTRHSICLYITLEMTAITSFSTTKEVVPYELVLAETIIVGAVPENYTEVLTESSELLGNINDYRAE